MAKILVNSLYKHLIEEKYYKDILFLSNEECDNHGEGYDVSEVELAVMQPYYFNKTFMDRMPNLKIAQITGAGYERVDLPEVKSRNVTLCNSRGVMSISIAEDVFCKILFISREVRTVEQDKATHHWDGVSKGQDQWMCTCYQDVYGKTLGIMGYGSIGHEIAVRAKAFGMKIHVYDVVEQKDPIIDECFVGMDRLPEFYPTCDYVVVSIPLNEKTRHIIDAKTFELMKDSAVLVNVARGPLVKTEDLIEALKEGKIKAAALDVYETEPLPADSPLWDVENLFMTSHKAGMGDTWKGFIGALIMRNIDHYQNGEMLENVIQL